MQELLEYVFFILDTSTGPIDKLDSQVLAEIKEKIGNLSNEELSSLIKLFDVYENYYYGITGVAYDFCNAIKQVDQESVGPMGIVDAFTSEISAISEHRNQYSRKFDMFGKLYDITEEVLRDKRSAKRIK